jgi:DNA-directed RNA polymerase subunit RPC12/RpoP
MAAIEELPEEVQDVQELQDVPGLQDVQGTGASEAPETVPSGKMTVIVCLECNKQLQVPIDQGMITVQCPECGMRRVYQPELDEAGELKTTTVIGCPSCKQKLNVPTNRGQLNVRCPRCGEKSLFTP